MDVYEILHLPSSASLSEAKQAYRKLVLVWHPDKNSNPDAHLHFIQIHEAYEKILNGIEKTYTQKSRPMHSPRNAEADAIKQEIKNLRSEIRHRFPHKREELEILDCKNFTLKQRLEILRVWLSKLNK